MEDINTDAAYATLLWAYTDGDEELDENYEVTDIDLESKSKFDAFIKEFYNECLDRKLVEKNHEHSDFCHNLVLELGGHGTGFWDKEKLYPHGQMISDLLKEKNIYFEPYVGDDGKIYFL
jgi:hypothetical protein